MTATSKHSLISYYTNTLFGNALCLVETSRPHSTCAHIYATTRFFHVQLGSTVVNSSFSFKSRPARVLLSRIKYTFVITGRNCFNARTRSPASKNLGSMSQCWPCTTGAELSQRNFSFEKQLDWSTVTTTLLFESKRQRIANTSL